MMPPRERLHAHGPTCHEHGRFAERAYDRGGYAGAFLELQDSLRDRPGLHWPADGVHLGRARASSVLGVDINPRTLEILRRGEIHIHEQGLREVYRAALAAASLKVAAQPKPADAFIIAVPTPFLEGELGSHDGQSYRLADLSAVRAGAESIVPVLRRGQSGRPRIHFTAADDRRHRGADPGALRA